MMDIAYALKRFDFLGKEFLTWLWYAVENQPDTLRRIDPEMAALEIGNRLVLHNKNQQSTETVTIRDATPASGQDRRIVRLRVVISP